MRDLESPILVGAVGDGLPAFFRDQCVGALDGGEYGASADPGPDGIFGARSSPVRDSRFGTESAILHERNVIQVGLCRALIARLGMHSRLLRCMRLQNGDTSRRAYIAFPRNIRRAIFDQNIGSGDQFTLQHFRLHRDAQYRSTRWIEGNFPVIGVVFAKHAHIRNPIAIPPINDATELHIIV